MNASNPDYPTLLTNAAEKADYVKLVLKDRGEHLGTIYKEQDPSKWRIVAPTGGMASTTLNQEVPFDVVEVQHFETIS